MISVIRKAFFSLLFPHTCPMCGAYIGEDARQGQICDECMQTLPRTEQVELAHNRTEMDLAGNTSDMVSSLKAMRLKRAAAFLFYEKESPIRQAIHKMKYADQPMIGFQLGKQAALEFQYTDFFDGIDVIVPMPLHPKRLRERGYNQAEYIARGLSEVTGIPIDITHVTRSRYTPKQALQSGEARVHNVAGAFDISHPEQMYRKHILLVDDLITTGETMRSCLKAMKRFRGATFTVFALCKAI